MRTTLLQGDCVERMRELAADSIDAIVCDPPYLIGFMGKDFDQQDGRHLDPKAMQEWHQAWAIEALRVLKPGGHLLAFGGTRTYHRLAAGIEDAGFRIRDTLAYLFGSGFPKSLSVHKATIAAVESRYGDARCDCLDARDGRVSRDDVGRESRGATRASGGSGALPEDQARAADVPINARAGRGSVPKLRQDDYAASEASSAVEGALLQPGVRGRGPEAARLGDLALRTRGGRTRERRSDGGTSAVGAVGRRRRRTERHSRCIT